MFPWWSLITITLVEQAKNTASPSWWMVVMYVVIAIAAIVTIVYGIKAIRL